MDTYRLDVDKIRRLGFNKGMSISKVCENAGLSRSRATGWRNRGVYASTVYKVAQVLGVDPIELIIEEAAE